MYLVSRMQPPPPYSPPGEDKHLHDRDLEAQVHVFSPITSESLSPSLCSPSYPQTTNDTALPPAYPSEEYTNPARGTEKDRALFPYARPDGCKEIQPQPDILSHQKALQDEIELSPFEQKILYTVIFVTLLSLPGLWVGMCVDWGVGLKLAGEIGRASCRERVF